MPSRLRNHALDGLPLRGEVDRACPGSGQLARAIWSDEDGRQACAVCARFILVVNDAFKMRERAALKVIELATAAGRVALGNQIADAIRNLGDEPTDDGV